MPKTKGLHFTPVDPKSIPEKRTGKAGVMAATIAEFVVSGAKAVEVDADGYKSVSSVSSGLRNAVKAQQCEKRVAVIVRGGRVYLLRTAA